MKDTSYILLPNLRILMAINNKNNINSESITDMNKDSVYVQVVISIISFLKNKLNSIDKILSLSCTLMKLTWKKDYYLVAVQK